MMIKKKEELIAKIDSNLNIIKQAASKMNFESIWECLSLFHIFKELHWFLCNTYEFNDNQIDVLVQLEYPLFVLVDYYRDIEDDDVPFDELIQYAVEEIKADAHLYRTDWQMIATALKE